MVMGREGLNVVFDGMAFIYDIHRNILYKSQGAQFCYEVIRREIYQFLDYLAAKNLNLKCIVLDTLYDESKFIEYCERESKRKTDLESFWGDGCKHYRNQSDRYDDL